MENRIDRKRRVGISTMKEEKGSYEEWQGACFRRGGGGTYLECWRTKGDCQGKNNLGRRTYKWKDPDGFQELPEARISEQDEQSEAVIREEVGKLGRGWIMWGFVGLRKKSIFF